MLPAAARAEARATAGHGRAPAGAPARHGGKPAGARSARRRRRDGGCSLAGSGRAEARRRRASPPSAPSRLGAPIELVPDPGGSVIGVWRRSYTGAACSSRGSTWATTSSCSAACPTSRSPSSTSTRRSTPAGTQRRLTLATSRDADGDRTGFGGRRYRTATVVEPQLRRPVRRLLRRSSSRGCARRGGCSQPTGRSTCTSTIARRTTARCCSTSSSGATSFLNEIIWAYDYGAPCEAPLAREARHDPRLRQGSGARTTSTPRPSTASRTWRPGSSAPEKAARGKLPTDVWWHTIVSPTGREKTGYPTQKPLGVLRRIVQASSRPGDWCLDFFAGSGTLGAAALELGAAAGALRPSDRGGAVMRSGSACRAGRRSALPVPDGGDRRARASSSSSTRSMAPRLTVISWPASASSSPPAGARASSSGRRRSTRSSRAS